MPWEYVSLVKFYDILAMFLIALRGHVGGYHVFLHFWHIDDFMSPRGETSRAAATAYFFPSPALVQFLILVSLLIFS